MLSGRGLFFKKCMNSESRHDGIQSLLVCQLLGLSRGMSSQVSVSIMNETFDCVCVRVRHTHKQVGRGRLRI